MRNFWLIFRREYNTRVFTPMFLVITLLAPLLLVAIGVLPALLGHFTEEEGWTVYVQQDLPFANTLPAQSSPQHLVFQLSEASTDSLATLVRATPRTMAIYAMGDTTLRNPSVTFYTHGSPGMNTLSRLKDNIRTCYKESRLLQAGISPTQLAQAESTVTFKAVRLTEKGEDEGSVLAGYAIGYILALANYIMLLVYGSMVLRGVIEEKANRIMEIMVSTVRPIHMLLGKMVGIGAVGFTQIVLWVIIGAVGLTIAGAVIAGSGVQPATPEAMGVEMADMETQAEDILHKIEEFTSVISLSLILLMLFYFLAGYFFYGSLFAAVGSAVDQESDSQQLVPFIILPIAIPMLTLTAIVNDPNGALAFWMSIIPFFSPVVMMVRVAAGSVPTWELLLSMGIMLASLWGILQLTARIYRVGILMYGKKPSIKEIARWIRVRI